MCCSLQAVSAGYIYTQTQQGRELNLVLMDSHGPTPTNVNTLQGLSLVLEAFSEKGVSAKTADQTSDT